MQKIGHIQLSTGNNFFIVYNYDKLGNYRLDILNELEDYEEFSSIESVSSVYNIGGKLYWYGNYELHKLVNSIIVKSTNLAVPEQKEVKIENNTFVIIIKKESDTKKIKYISTMEAGKNKSESYETEDGYVEYSVYRASDWSSKYKPANWGMYQEVDTEFTKVTKTATKLSSNNALYLSYDELLRKYPQVSHVLDNDYKIALSYEEAVERLKQWVESKEQLKSIDIESYGTDWGPFSKNRITGVFLGFGETWSTYFPFRQDNFPYNLPIEFLREIFDAVNNQPKYPTVIILAHNAKFEIQGFYQEFYDYLRIDVDTYVLGVLVNPIIQKGSHTLKNLTSQVDKKFYLTLEHIFIKDVKFNVLPPEIVLLYGCPDATSPAKVYKSLMKKLPKDELFVKKLDMSILTIKAINEFYGIRMNQDSLNKLIETEDYKVNLLSNLFKKLCKTSKNINSSDVLSDIIYNQMRCKVDVYTDKGRPATSKFAIDRIIDVGTKTKEEIDKITSVPEDIKDNNGKVIIKGKDLASNRYPNLIIYQQYKKCGKELGALKRLKDRSVGGYFKFYINQVGAGSNRQTSDAHQFSDTMKMCAVADSKYHGLVSCDYKQVELRILAGMAGEEPLIEQERDPDIDIHRAILSLIKRKPIYLISEEERKSGKSVNFGVVYMMSEYGLARRDFGPKYTKAQVIEERNKITDFFNALPKIKMFLHNNEITLKEKGYIKTLFNYYRYFPELLDPTTDPKLVKRLIRSGNNTPVQGTGAQLLKMAESRCWEYIRKKGWDKVKEYDGVKLPMVRMILPIHDEILLSYDKSIPKEEIIVMFKYAMEIDIDGMPPFFAAPAFIDNWYEGKDPVYEVDIPFRNMVIDEFNKGNYIFKDSDKDYVQILKDYRNSEIKNYMDDLIRQFKTPEEVAKHVTHGSITHTLIETKIKKEDRKKISHEERIALAVKRYMEDNTTDVVKEEIEEIKTELLDLDEWSTNIMYTDQFGNLVTESLGEDAEYEDTTGDDGMYEFVYNNVDSEETYIPEYIYLASECLIDLTAFTKEQAQNLISKLEGYSNKNNYYSVCFVRGDKTMKSDIKIGNISNELNKIFNEVRL